MVVCCLIEVRAADNSEIEATIALSICGNDVIEGGEDCEGENINSQTCEGLGFGPGTLTCDIACSFDTHECSPAPTPTPTPSPTPTPIPTLTPVPTATPTNAPSSATSTSNSPTITLTSTPTPKPFVFTNVIPEVLRLFAEHLDSNGRITAGQLYAVVKTWVDDWREVLAEQVIATDGEIVPTKGRKCDVNQDNRCDIKDLSVILFYVEK